MTRLYLITPSVFMLPEFAVQLETALSGGDVACVQLRMKEASSNDIKAAAKALMPIVKAHGAEFILNDHPELAVEVGADGVHLGDEDMTAAEAREIVGERTVGISCYASKDRAFEAGDEGADYVAFGQFYETKTKPAKGHPTPELLEFWSKYTNVPCVAIGGIKPDNLAPLVKAGADFIAVVTGVWEHPKGPKAAVAEYNAAIAKARG